MEHMTDIADRYRRLSTSFARLVTHVPDDGWKAATPCPGWDTRQLVEHVVGTQGLIRSLVGRETPDVDVTADPDGAWALVSGLVQGDLDDPERAGSTFQGRFGEQTFEAAVDRFLNFDLVIHGWDLAWASGQDEHIDPGDVRHVTETARGLGDALRSPQAFGPELEVSPDADERVRLLAFLGRRA